MATLPGRLGLSVLYGYWGFTTIFLFWAAIAWVDEIVRAPGEVISSSRPQIIQNLEGGILSELLVKEGDEVEELFRTLGRTVLT